MRIPNRRTRQFVREIADQCNSSRVARTNRGTLYQSYYDSGSSDPSAPAMFNKTFASIDDLESLLYSPVSLRFHIGDPDLPNVVNEAKGKAAAAKIRQQLRQCDGDSLISQAVNSSLIKGIGLIKHAYKGDAFAPHLVMPENFGVLRENHTKLDQDMEAFNHSMLITPHQLYRLIAGRPDEDEIRKKMKNYIRETKGGVSDTRASAMNIVVGGLYPLQQAGNGVAQARGIVDWMSAPKPDIAPDVEATFLEMDETWIWNDEQDDWTTFQTLGDDIMIAGRYSLHNMLAWDPRNKIMSTDLKGQHPFCTFCANPVPEYFWGLSEIMRLMLLQEAINSRITGMNRLLRKEEDPPIKFTGGSGVNQLALSRFNKPGGYYTDASPQAKIERDQITIPQDFWNALHEFERLFDETMGLPPTARGHGEKGVRSANHAEALVRMFSPRFKDRALLVERNVEHFGALTLDLAKAHVATKLTAWAPKDAAGVESGATDEELKVLIPPAESLVPVYFQFADLPDDLTLTVDSHSSSPAFSQEEKALTFDLAKIGAMSPSDVVEHVDVSDPENLQMSILRRDIAKAKAAQQEQQLKLVSHSKK